jgi:hypothetical protein
MLQEIKLKDCSNQTNLDQDKGFIEQYKLYVEMADRISQRSDCKHVLTDRQHDTCRGLWIGDQGR